ncbi:hypothetical protein [Chitinophaga pinensis]|uniref:DUF6249 domain-containing protein n=1 Tax=Chitinophaga pinensis TaxID=79329 RepID=A0A5C6LLB9_9BACT|nr:hypothetical protein [Chitinophaga pinensis]TWV90901.1 hypothetical protein FEF09_29200 [Chitinophaga pinensis]
MFNIIETLGSFIMIISVFAITASLIVSFLNYRLRRRMLDAGPIDDNALKLLPTIPKTSSDMLKWGIILFFAGLGLIVLEFIPFNVESSPLPYGVETVFIATGFLVYYFLISRTNK